MAEVEIKDRSRLLRRGIGILWWANGLLALVWPFASYISIFFFDRPGSVDDPMVWLIGSSIWIYPLVAAGCAYGAYRLVKRHQEAGALLVSLLPLFEASACWILLNMQWSAPT